MKAIMISIKPKWCAKIMNGEKTIEVRKNKALANAIQGLIEENGFADIYVYCTKEEELYKFNWGNNTWYENFKHFTNMCCGHFHALNSDNLNGKVIFKFRCDKVEEMRPFFHWCVEKESCLTRDEVLDYLDSKDTEVSNPKRQGKVYAIHISDLEIFDKPKALSEFYKVGYLEALENSLKAKPFPISSQFIQNQYLLRKAPQNFCYVEVE